MNDDRSLRRLARLFGIQTEYLDVARRTCHASEESLLATLKVLGAAIENVGDAATLLRGRRQQLWQRAVPPVAVAWEGQGTVRIRIDAARATDTLDCHLALENGGQRQWAVKLADIETGRRTVEGITYRRAEIPLPSDLPLGYHDLHVTFGRTKCSGTSCRIIAAPREAFQHPHSSRNWGVFLPLYALHRESSWGAGDFSDLSALMYWVARQGGRLVANLPMLAWQSELNDDPSPYAPSSRLFFNEFFVDVDGEQDVAASLDARRLMASADFQGEIAALRASPTVDYERQMRIKRSVLELAAAEFYAKPSPRQERFEQFFRDRPEFDAFARYRAVCQRRSEHWPSWPARPREGTIEEGDYDEDAYRYYRYMAWVVEGQLQGLSDEAAAHRMMWYLDFPLGVNRVGYDVWRYRELFALGASGGAPPDAFFTKGQCWGFPPLHPEALRERGYEYFITAIRRHLEYAKLLRIDHAMGLYRLFFVPDGMEARQGAYVRYRSDELFAILALESHRHEAQIVGENLGTVPDAVEVALDRHRVGGMYVVQYEAKPDRRPRPLPKVPDTDVASINTHDMPMFHAYWRALDVADRVDLGLMTEEEAAAERDRRAALRRRITAMLASEGLLTDEGETTHDADAALEALLTWLAASDAPIVLANLEDLFGETEPQNTPGTFDERINWRRRSRHSLEAIDAMDSVGHILRTMAEARSERAVEASGTMG